MEHFLNEVIEWEKFELLIDTNIFNKDIILKASYSYLDKWYFFFKYDKDNNIILCFTKKEWEKINPNKIILEFTDTLLETVLRDKLEKDNKIIRETIVTKAINWPFDYNNFVSLDTDNIQNQEWQWQQNQIDFDKDIDEILKEIENDPELKIDEEEIEKILKEIEEESANEEEVKPVIQIDKEAIKKAKEQFKK